MKKDEIILTYDQLLNYIKESDLTNKEISQLLFESIQVISDETKPRDILIKEFAEFVLKFGKGIGEKPIFLGMSSLDVE